MYKNLLPFPRELSVSDGSCALTPQFKVYAPEGVPLDGKVGLRLGEIRALTGLELPVEKMASAPGPLRLVLKGSAPAGCDLAAPEGAQAYALKVCEHGVCVCANDTQGIFYGLTTLLQMLRENAKALACCAIRDWPAIAIRGHFDDISRKRVSTTEDFKEIVRELGRFKINYYSPYLEDVLHLRAFPDIGRKRGKLMPSEVKEIVAEAALNGVEVIPFFQLIGHYENLLAMPNYEYLGQPVRQQMSSLNPNNPEVREFLRLCIEEACALFPCEFFGMGFDETQGVDGDTYIRHANWCAEELAKHGRKALLWADMFHKTFGMERVTELNPNIILVNWQYGCVEKPIPYQKEFEATGRTVWGFGWYSNCGVHLPDLSTGKKHMETWSSHIAGVKGQALLYSQWGDDGYENNRDLGWPLFVYAGETSWRGDAEHKATYDARFAEHVCGCELPRLTEVMYEVAPKLNFTPHEYWRIHRLNAFAAIRKARSLDNIEKFQQDLEILGGALNGMVEEYRANYKKMRAHGKRIYSHFVIAAMLQEMNAEKMLLSYELANGVDEAAERQIMALTTHIRACREAYMADWMRTNRREGLEVSARVFDDVAASYEELIANSNYRRKGFKPVNLDSAYNSCFLDIGGVPIGEARVAGIPFRFAGVDKTFVKMNAACREISAAFDETLSVKDLHIIAASPMQENLEKFPLLKLKLTRGGQVVWEDTLNATEHISDWWAPACEHMWAGGGYRFIDRARVTPALVPNLNFGLAITSRFPRLAAGVAADGLCIEWVGNNDVTVFAATVQTV